MKRFAATFLVLSWVIMGFSFTFFVPMAWDWLGEGGQNTRVWAWCFLFTLSTGAWLWWGIGLCVVGWAIQFVGHVYEGRKPAFVDDLVGLVIGPLFVVAEAVFALGLRRDLHAAIEQRAGPVRQRAPAGRGAARP